MEFRDIERIQNRMSEMQPREPEWCKAEKMEMSISLRKLWHMTLGARR